MGDDLDAALGHDVGRDADHGEPGRFLPCLGRDGSGEPHQRKRLETFPCDAGVITFRLIGGKGDQVQPGVARQLCAQLAREGRVDSGSEHLEIPGLEHGALISRAAAAGWSLRFRAAHVSHEGRQVKTEFLEPLGRCIEIGHEQPDVVQKYFTARGDERGRSWMGH